MTSLVLGAVGGIAGSMLGGPIGGQIGYLAGSLLGSLIDPPKIQGPRLGDTKLQRSTYGAMLPYAWGYGRIGTNVIDQTDLVEHEHRSGGKGGPETTNYTYSASWLAALCTKLPNRDAAIIGVTHIFADGRLIWSENSDQVCPCTIYYGTETQKPDPDFEGIHGTGKQPAYRGLAYLKFWDTDLTDYGNRIPNIEAVILTKGGDIPWRFLSQDLFAARGSYGTPHGLQATYSDGVITVTWPESAAETHFFFEQFDLQGNVVTPIIESVVPGGAANAVNNLNAYVLQIGLDFQWYHADLNTASPTFGHFIPGVPHNAGVGLTLNGNFNIFANGRIYYCENYLSLAHVNYIGASGGIPDETVIGHAYALDGNYAASNVALAHDENGNIYASYFTGTGVKLWKLDADLNLIHFWDEAQTAGTKVRSFSGNFLVWNNLIAVDYQFGATHSVAVVRINGDNTLEDVGVTLVSVFGRFIDIGNGLGIDSTAGIFSLHPPPAQELLSDIVDDLASLTPATTYDNAELTDTVRWFLAGQQATVRNYLDKLRQPFFFDLVEEDYSINARKRTDRTVYIIPDDDLDAREYGEDPGDFLTTTRKREQELPRTVTMTFIDPDLDWQTNAQSSPRQTTLSEYDVQLEVPVAFTATEGAQKCWSIQAEAWTARESFAWKLPRQYAYLTPCMWAKVRGRDIRITKVTESPTTGILSFEGVLAAPSLYTTEVSGHTTNPGAAGGGGDDPSAGGSQQGSTSSGTIIATEWALLDIPVLSLGDFPNGFYWVAGRANATGKWTGSTLYQSKDGGNTWTDIASTSFDHAIGILTEAGGSPTVSATQLGTYLLGDTVQEVSVMVYLSSANQTLTSITSTALTNGGNLCAMSAGTFGGSPTGAWEIMQFRDALQVSDHYWLLTGWKRGRKGTTPLAHAAGDSFVMLDHGQNVDMASEDLNKNYLYRSVSFGQSVTDAVIHDFTNTGISGDSWGSGVVGTIPVFEGDTGSPGGGNPGLVPAPADGDCAAGKFLSACGTWDTPSGSGGVSDGDKGDIVVSSSGAVWTIDAGVVSNAKLGAMAAHTFKVRKSGTTGDPEDAISSEATALLDVFAGDGVSPGPLKGLVPAPSNGDGTSQKFLMADGTWQQVKQGLKVLNQAYASSLTIDLSSYSMYSHFQVNVTALTGNLTLNISGGSDGQIIRVRLVQDGTGGRTLSAGSNIVASTDLPLPVLSTTGGQVDLLGFQWHEGPGSPSGFAYLVAYVRGFAQ